MATLTAGEVINHARDTHPLLSEANAPSALAYRALSRFQQALVQGIYMRQPAMLAQFYLITFPLDSFTDGVDLRTLIPTGWLDILEGFVQWAGGNQNEWTKRAQQVPWEQRDMPQPWPAYTVFAETLYPLGPESAWTRVASLRLSVTRQPDDVVDDDTALIVPVDAREALATQLQAFYLKRLVGNPQFNVNTDMVSLAMQDAKMRTDEFLDRIARVGQRQSYRVRDVT